MISLNRISPLCLLLILLITLQQNQFILYITLCPGRVSHSTAVTDAHLTQIGGSLVPIRVVVLICFSPMNRAIRSDTGRGPHVPLLSRVVGLLGLDLLLLVLHLVHGHLALVDVKGSAVDFWGAAWEGRFLLAPTVVGI